ncbi:pyruvate:ferredoxin (flavodoxin) oxidoreductase [Leptolinea tardivitalis]|uniref:Pyruvate-flavodoxin oxidoreductase n=1 Tax=Leptolinea tardivitalis TaxID=229920 RepID=A0A0P6X908_9CHLR|nr:pyruvate:ferredoxin (flavodoxin) oxidoreductase [Leptolinea tardivitalis]KPL70757.1 pyruvate-flavodoxin oxidoreductase [Leptolinea tardivitalis]GAP22286.1 pyruvate:ferredoxin (flavodoxin) oxidoreductase, homodimeric [Leptolinea tardivitalis]
MPREKVTLDANEAVADIAYKLSEVIAIFPITPSSTMGEWADQWAGAKLPNLWGTVPSVVEMQSEGGAAGAVHGALQAGALSTTFTASQGLLLMIPNMFKIAGELTATVFHVSARALATHALSIYGDHSDVMAARSTGFAMLTSRSVQEAHDMALIAHAATLEARVPFVHFFDGFRTSAEVNKIERLTNDDIRAMVEEKFVTEHRERALSPDHPVLRGTAQNPDVYFQGRETVNPFYAATPAIVQKYMDKFAKIAGRSYQVMEYFGAKDADRVVVAMCSGAETAEETAKFLMNKGEKVGVLTVRLYRPFSVEHFLKVLPATVKKIAVLDRTKEPGATGEPLFQDVVAAIAEGITNGTAPFKTAPVIIGGRYGLSSKEFTPGMAKAVFDELKKDTPKGHFTVGINDDLTHSSLEYDADLDIESPKTVRCVFFGLGADGTVGANKNSIKIIGEETDNNAQGYFYYDSKKSGSVTISHLRFGPEPIRAPYLIRKANFVACHQYSFLERFDMTRYALPGAVFLLNSIYGPEEVWDKLPQEVQKDIIAKKLKFYTIDANEVAQKTGMGGRVNTIMQTCFFAISGVLPRDLAIAEIKKSIKKTYGKRGEAVVKQNFDAVDAALDHLHEIKYPEKVTSKLTRRPSVSDAAPKFVKDVLGQMIIFEGDELPVSAMPVDGTFPTGTSQWEKRNIALEIPVWDPGTCIQCGKCSFVCPHAVIRQKVYDPALLKNAPATFKSVDAKFKEMPGTKFTIQVSPEDCTGCGLCVEACPSKNKADPSLKAINMAEQPPIREQENVNWDFFLSLPEVDRTAFQPTTVKNSQLLQPLFEFSGACGGCGETPYIKLVSQLFGDRMVVANATGCTSIYGGNLPTTPWSQNKDGRGPAWSNSLFEDNAEFGLGMRLTIDKQTEFAQELLKKFAGQIGDSLVSEILNADQSTDAGIKAQRDRVDALKKKLADNKDILARQLVSIADVLVKKSVWIMGGDGWAYDIGYGGLDHVLASGRNVNVLVLDTEVYSNTGGQASKSTPRAAVAKFAARGKGLPKKDLGMIAMAYGYVYVARVAMGSNDAQTLKAFLEADAYNGPSLIIAYSHCINHGIDMRRGLDQQKAAVNSGMWPLYRYNPALVDEGKNPLLIDSKDPTIPVSEYAYKETRYRMLLQSDEARAEMLMKEVTNDAAKRWDLYKSMAAIEYKAKNPES